MSSKSSNFSKQISITLVARVLMVFNSVASGVLIARWLGAEGVGIYAVLMLTAGGLIQIVGAGLTSANVFYAKREPELLAKIAANSLAFAAVGGIGAAALAYTASLLRPDWFHNVPSHLLMISLGALPFQLWTFFGLGLFLAQGAVRKFNLLDVFGQSFVLLNAVFVLVILGASLDLLVLFNVLAAVLIALSIAVLIRRTVTAENATARFSPDAALFGRMMRFGLNINVMNAALALILRADVLLVNYFRGEAEAGVYSVAAQFSLLLILFPNVVGTMLFPNVAGMKTGSAAFTSSVIRHAGVIQLTLCIVSIPSAFLLPFLYGPAFSAATVQFLVLLPGAMAIGLQMMLSQHLVGTGKISLLPYFWIVTLILSVGLNLWLVPVYGGLGAAAVSTAAYLLIFLLTLFYFRKQTGERIFDLLWLRGGEARALFTRFRW